MQCYFLCCLYTVHEMIGLCIIQFTGMKKVIKKVCFLQKRLKIDANHRFIKRIDQWFFCIKKKER